MLTDSDSRYLVRAIELNKCVLFLGAGFSVTATNRRGEGIPASRDMAGQLWSFLGYAGEYDGSPLALMYEAALSSGLPRTELAAFLDDRVLAEAVPSWLAIVPQIFWYRLYSTNIDNVVELAYRTWPGESKLKVFNGFSDDYDDRDQFIRTVQYVKLNGSWPTDPANITFSQRQYAQRAAEHDVWYDHFVRDYVQQPVIFIGSQLDEPLFWQALEARERRGHGSEERPKSFLVAPRVSPPKKTVLRNMNVVPVEGEAETFLAWLRATLPVQTRTAVLQAVVPDVAPLLLRAELNLDVVEALEEMLSAFTRVPALPQGDRRRMEFFLGAVPTWSDLARDLDAPRDITGRLVSSIDAALSEGKSLRVFGVLGAGGAGKTTILRRAALILRQTRGQVFFSDGATRPAIDATVKALESLPDRAVIFIDSAHLLGPVLYELSKALARVSKPPVLVFASRFNLFERALRPVAAERFCELFTVGDLSDSEITNLLAKLEQHVQLGKLETSSPSERFHAFKVRAQKQILVAMREATAGEGFNEIIRTEYSEVGEHEARLLYVCAALGTAEGIDLRKDQWIACGSRSPADTLDLLRGELRGVVVEGDEGRTVGARHSLIAAQVIDVVATRDDLRQGYVRVLNVLAHDVYGGRGRRGRSWRLIVRLISHSSIYRRFGGDLNLARSIYADVKEWFRRDGHFWLQWCNLEIEYGQLEFARAYLTHALGLIPDQPLVRTTAAHLLYKEAIAAPTREAADAKRIEADEILMDQIARDGARDEYPFHVYLTQRTKWLKHWVVERQARREAFEEMQQVADEAINLHGYSRKIREAADALRQDYLRTAV